MCLVSGFGSNLWLYGSVIVRGNIRAPNPQVKINLWFIIYLVLFTQFWLFPSVIVTLYSWKEPLRSENAETVSSKCKNSYNLQIKLFCRFHLPSQLMSPETVTLSMLLLSRGCAYLHWCSGSVYLVSSQQDAGFWTSLCGIASIAFRIKFLPHPQNWHLRLSQYFFMLLYLSCSDIKDSFAGHHLWVIACILSQMTVLMRSLGLQTTSEKSKVKICKDLKWNLLLKKLSTLSTVCGFHAA